MKLTTETIKRLIKEELSSLLREGPEVDVVDILEEYYDEIEYSVLKGVYDDIREGIDSQSSVMGPLFGMKLVINDWNRARPKFNYHFRMTIENLEFDKPANLANVPDQHWSSYIKSRRSSRNCYEG